MPSTPNVGQLFALFDDVKYVPMAGLWVPGPRRPGPQSSPLVLDKEVRVKALVAQAQQVSGPGVTITVLLRAKHIAVSRARIQAAQDRFIAVENLVIQAHPDGRQVLSHVELKRTPSNALEQIVHTAKTDGHTRQVAHEMHHASV